MINRLYNLFHKPVKVAPLPPEIGEINIENNTIHDRIEEIKEEAIDYVSKQIGRLEISKLEEESYERIHKYDRNIMNHKLASKLCGIPELLEYGEFTFLLLSKLAKEDNIPTAILQTFCNASEIMIYVTYCLIVDEDTLVNFIEMENGKSRDKPYIGKLVDDFDNEALKLVLIDYRNNRNIAAHSYKLISVEAAESFIQRTYESIQRMELIIHP